MNKNYRKIAVGDSFSNCIAYVKGATYLRNTIEITDIVSGDTEGYLDIYVKPARGEGPKSWWKSVSESKILEYEGDLNFE